MIDINGNHLEIILLQFIDYGFNNFIYQHFINLKKLRITLKMVNI